MVIVKWLVGSLVPRLCLFLDGCHRRYASPWQQRRVQEWAVCEVRRCSEGRHLLELLVCCHRYCFKFAEGLEEDKVHLCYNVTWHASHDMHYMTCVTSHDTSQDTHHMTRVTSHDMTRVTSHDTSHDMCYITWHASHDMCYIKWHASHDMCCITWHRSIHMLPRWTPWPQLASLSTCTTNTMNKSRYAVWVCVCVVVLLCKEQVC